MPCNNLQTRRAMTLSENTHSKEKEMKMEFNKLFKEVLMKAVEQGRVTTGIFNCAKQLQMYPERVMFCVMPVNKDGDDSSDIQHVLLKAYCCEQHIRIIYVDSCDMLGSLVQNRKDKTADYSCLLIGRSRDAQNHLETKFCNEYKELLHKLPWPVVQVPQ